MLAISSAFQATFEIQCHVIAQLLKSLKTALIKQAADATKALKPEASTAAASSAKLSKAADDDISPDAPETCSQIRSSVLQEARVLLQVLDAVAADGEDKAVIFPKAWVSESIAFMLCKCCRRSQSDLNHSSYQVRPHSSHSSSKLRRSHDALSLAAAGRSFASSKSVQEDILLIASSGCDITSWFEFRPSEAMHSDEMDVSDFSIRSGTRQLLGRAPTAFQEGFQGGGCDEASQDADDDFLDQVRFLTLYSP